MKNNHQGWFLAKLKLAALLKMSFSKYLFHEHYLTFFTELLLMATSERTEAVVCKMFFKIDVPENFANFTRKLLCWSLFLIKLQALACNFIKKSLQHSVSYEHSEIFNNTSFTEQLRQLFLKGLTNQSDQIHIFTFYILVRKKATTMGHQQYIDEMSIDNERPEVTEAKVEKLIKYQLLRFARKRRLLCKNGKALFFLS